MNIENMKKRFKEELMDLYSELEYKSLLDKIAEKIKLNLKCEAVSFFLYNQSNGELSFETATGSKSDILKTIILKKGEGIAGWIAEKGEGVLINNCEQDERFTNKTDKKTSFKTKSMIGVPVKRGDKLLGVLEVINKINDNFKDDELKILQSVAGYIAIPMHNALLFKELMHETQNKEQLIELAKGISSSDSLEDIFDILKNIIIGLIDPVEISVFVSSDKKVYNLISKKNQSIEKNNGSQDTRIVGRNAIFPLRTGNKTIGMMEIQLQNELPKGMSYIIKGIAIFAAISIEKYEMHRQVIEKEKIEKELQIAREIQQSFLLKNEVDISDIDYSFANITSSEVGGDYYDVIKLNEKETVFTINDISGHGIPASLLMSIFRANFTYLIGKNKDIKKTLTEVNNIIAETTDSNLYVTSFTLIVDSENDCVNFINAGHNAPFIIRDNKVILLDEGNLVLGMFPDVIFEMNKTDLKEGDILVLYTDGVIEAENKNGEQYSTKRFIEFIKKNINFTAREIKENLIRELRKFTDSKYFTDDVTFMILIYKKNNPIQ